MKSQFLILSSVLIFGGSVVSAGTTPPAPLTPSGRPVARVNGAVVTDRDLLREMYAIFPYAAQHNGSFPKAMEADIRQGALEMLVFEELVYQEALRRKLDVSPAKLNHALAEFHTEFPSQKEYQQFMKTELNGSTELLRTRIRRIMLIERMLKLEVTDKAGVTLAEARAFYLNNPARFRIPESVKVQTISIMPPAKATAAQLEEARKRAQDALKQAKATKTYEQFGMLAEKISQDDYRVMMGDHRTVDIAKLPVPVAQTAAGMQLGQVSDLVRVDQNYTIVRLNGRVAAGSQKFEEVKDSLMKQLEKSKTEQLRTALAKKLRVHAKVEQL